MRKYSIIIPVHNEEKHIPSLLESLRIYIKEGHEIIIIDDGSTDHTKSILENTSDATLISLKVNEGKGYAIREGLKKAKFDRIIIYDGDMELNPSQLRKLMVLEKENKIKFAVGYRFNSLSPIKSNFDWGNFMFTSFFNISFNSNFKDVLCCAKSFYLSDLGDLKLNSRGFDVDAELAVILHTLHQGNSLLQVNLNYKRRSIDEGKKLKVSDGWIILNRLFKMLISL